MQKVHHITTDDDTVIDLRDRPTEVRSRTPAATVPTWLVVCVLGVVPGAFVVYVVAWLLGSLVH